MISSACSVIIMDVVSKEELGIRRMLPSFIKRSQFSRPYVMDFTCVPKNGNHVP